MPSMSESLLDPRVNFAVWQYDCADIECKACPPYRKATFGVEDWFSDDESGGDRRMELTGMPYEGSCNLCDTRTINGFEYGMNEYGVPNLRWCCGDPTCMEYTIDGINEDEAEAEEDIRSDNSPRCAYCTDITRPLAPFWLDASLYYHCDNPRCADQAQAEIEFTKNASNE